MGEPHLIPTARPGVYLVESERQKGRFYTLTNVGSPFVICNCEAAQHERECKHLRAGLRKSIEEVRAMGEVTDMEKTRAVAIARRSVEVARAESLSMQAAAQLAAWNDLRELGAGHIKSGFAPKGVDTPEKAAMIILKAMELRIPATSAYEFIDVIEGRPRLRGQMVAALVERSGHGYIAIEQSSATECTAVGVRQGRKSIRITVRLDDFRHLMEKGIGWKHYPADMLRWKAIARVGRVMFADVLGGMDVSADFDGEGTLVDASSDAGGARIEVLEGEYTTIASTPAREVAEAVDLQTGEIVSAAPASAPAEPAWYPEFKLLLQDAALGLPDFEDELAGGPIRSKSTLFSLVDLWLERHPGEGVAGLVSTVLTARATDEPELPFE